VNFLTIVAAADAAVRYDDQGHVERDGERARSWTSYSLQEEPGPFIDSPVVCGPGRTTERQDCDVGTKISERPLLNSCKSYCGRRGDSRLRLPQLTCRSMLTMFDIRLCRWGETKRPPPTGCSC
jgi:hypothetical protein